MQKKVSRPVPMNEMYEICPSCSMGFISLGGTRPCAHCQAGKEIEMLHRTVSAQNLAMEAMRRKLESIEAMRVCLDLIDHGDTVQVKQVLYAFREDPKKVVIAVAYKPQTDSVSGFAVEERFTPKGTVKQQNRVSVYEMHSMGGVALATEYETAARMYKTTQASAMLLRAVGHLLEVNSS